MRQLLIFFLLIAFTVSALPAAPAAFAQPLLGLPEPGSMVGLTPAYQPVLLQGITVHKDNPFQFDFLVDRGQDQREGAALTQEGQRLINYFLASLAVPQKDVWVNLSPYERERTIPEVLGQTEMGRDLLAQDYLLKQITASLLYPEKGLGRDFWNAVYARAGGRDGSTPTGVNAFHKVWIVADKAEVFERNQTAFVTACHFKVMLEEDYLASKHQGPGVRPANANNASRFMRDAILPVLEKEVNEGKNFAVLRQISHALLLASWYKKNLNASVLNAVYSNQGKVRGIDLNDKAVNAKIYERYLQAYKKGVFNLIKEDPASGPAGGNVPRKYFSGGFQAGALTNDFAQTSNPARLARVGRHGLVALTVTAKPQPKAPSAVSFHEVYRRVMRNASGRKDKPEIIEYLGRPALLLSFGMGGVKQDDILDLLEGARRSWPQLRGEFWTSHARYRVMFTYPQERLGVAEEQAFLQRVLDEIQAGRSTADAASEPQTQPDAMTLGSETVSRRSVLRVLDILLSQGSTREGVEVPEDLREPARALQRLLLSNVKQYTTRLHTTEQQGAGLLVTYGTGKEELRKLKSRIQEGKDAEVSQNDAAMLVMRAVRPPTLADGSGERQEFTREEDPALYNAKGKFAAQVKFGDRVKINFKGDRRPVTGTIRSIREGTIELVEEGSERLDTFLGKDVLTLIVLNRVWVFDGYFLSSQARERSERALVMYTKGKPVRLFRFSDLGVPKEDRFGTGTGNNKMIKRSGEDFWVARMLDRTRQWQFVMYQEDGTGQMVPVGYTSEYPVLVTRAQQIAHFEHLLAALQASHSGKGAVAAAADRAGIERQLYALRQEGAVQSSEAERGQSDPAMFGTTYVVAKMVREAFGVDKGGPKGRMYAFLQDWVSNPDGHSGDGSTQELSTKLRIYLDRNSMEDRYKVLLSILAWDESMRKMIKNIRAFPSTFSLHKRATSEAFVFYQDDDVSGENGGVVSGLAAVLSYYLSTNSWRMHPTPPARVRPVGNSIVVYLDAGDPRNKEDVQGELTRFIQEQLFPAYREGLLARLNDMFASNNNGPERMELLRSLVLHTWDDPIRAYEVYWKNEVNLRSVQQSVGRLQGASRALAIVKGVLQRLVPNIGSSPRVEWPERPDAAGLDAVIQEVEQRLDRAHGKDAAGVHMTVDAAMFGVTYDAANMVREAFTDGNGTDRGRMYSFLNRWVVNPEDTGLAREEETKALAEQLKKLIFADSPAVRHQVLLHLWVREEWVGRMIHQVLALRSKLSFSTVGRHGTFTVYEGPAGETLSKDDLRLLPSLAALLSYYLNPASKDAPVNGAPPLKPLKIMQSKNDTIVYLGEGDARNENEIKPQLTRFIDEQLFPAYREGLIERLNEMFVRGDNGPERMELLRALVLHAWDEPALVYRSYRRIATSLLNFRNIPNAGLKVEGAARALNVVTGVLRQLVRDIDSPWGEPWPERPDAEHLNAVIQDVERDLRYASKPVGADAAGDMRTGRPVDAAMKALAQQAVATVKSAYGEDRAAMWRVLNQWVTGAQRGMPGMDERAAGVVGRLNTLMDAHFGSAAPDREKTRHDITVCILAQSQMAVSIANYFLSSPWRQREIRGRKALVYSGPRRGTAEEARQLLGGILTTELRYHFKGDPVSVELYVKSGLVRPQVSVSLPESHSRTAQEVDQSLEAFFAKLQAIYVENVFERLDNMTKSVEREALIQEVFNLYWRSTLRGWDGVLGVVRRLAAELGTADVITGGMRAAEVVIKVDGELRARGFRDEVISGETLARLVREEESKQDLMLLSQRRRPAVPTDPGVKRSSDQAVISGRQQLNPAVDRASTRGGIDLSASRSGWATRTDGAGVDMTVDAALLARLQRDGLDGLLPEITAITPVASIWPLVGLSGPPTP